MDAHHAALSSLSIGTDSDKQPPKHVDEGQLALQKEVRIFNNRERFFVAFRVSINYANYVAIRLGGVCIFLLKKANPFSFRKITSFCQLQLNFKIPFKCSNMEVSLG